MNTNRQTKPTIDAVNDAVGALSDLLHSIRAHAAGTVRTVKSKTDRLERGVVSTRRASGKLGKNVARGARARADGLLGSAARAWDRITRPESPGSAVTVTAVATRTRRSPRRAK